MPDENDALPHFDPLMDDDASPGRESRGFVPEFLRKVAVAGLGAVFMTEEGVRSLASQLKLPKEVLGFIVGQAERTKDEVGRVLSEELRRFFQSETLRSEFLKVMQSMSVEVTAQIRLVAPEKPAGAPVPKVTVTRIGAKVAGKRKPKE